MRFQRAKLIARVKEEISKRKAVTAQRNAVLAEKHAAKRDAYVADTAEAWKRFADVIRLRLRTGQPITDADIPKGLRVGSWRSSLLVWDDKAPTAYEPDIADLRQMLALLEAAEDDEVTTSALERLGIKTAQVFRA